MTIRSLLKNMLPYAVTMRVKAYLDGYDAFKANFKGKAKVLQDNERFLCRWEDRRPCLYDATEQTAFEPVYTYHPAWAARVLAEKMPSEHYDIGSTLAFITMVSAFLPVKFYDYRPAPLTLSGLTCGRVDLFELPFDSNSIESLSCMHVVEHIGLERYGDSFNPKGDLIAMKELSRVLKPGGHLLFAVPMGEQALIEYNAQRIYTYDQIISAFAELCVESFAFIKGDGEYVPSASLADINGQREGCGCFCFIKPSIT